MKHLLLSFFGIMILTGCNNERIVEIYVDENGTKTYKNRFETVDFKVVCDKHGYAYYSWKVAYSPYTQTDSYMPILESNAVGGIVGSLVHRTCDEMSRR